MKPVLFISILFVLVACGSSNQKNTNETSKELNNMIDNKMFEIKSNWALPRVTAAMQQLGNAGLFVNGSTVGNIDISRHTNYLKIKKDSVKAILPFYGERQFGGGYGGTNGGIEFEGVPDDLQINKGEKASYEIRFSITDKNSNTDHYSVFIKLLPDLSSIININSSSRSNIQYRGKVYVLNNN